MLSAKPDKCSHNNLYRFLYSAVRIVTATCGRPSAVFCSKPRNGRPHIHACRQNGRSTWQPSAQYVRVLCIIHTTQYCRLHCEYYQPFPCRVGGVKTKKLPLRGFFLLIALSVFKNRTLVRKKNSFLGRNLCGGVHERRKFRLS